MESAKTWTPSQPYGIANVDKQPRDRQMPCKGRNLPTAPAQIRCPQVFPICCYSLAVSMGKWVFRRRALWRPHPTHREVSCGDTDMDWHRPRAGSQDNVRVGWPEHKALFAYRNTWTLLMEVSAVRSTVLADRNLSSTKSSGSKGPL